MQFFKSSNSVASRYLNRWTNINKK